MQFYLQIAIIFELLFVCTFNFYALHLLSYCEYRL